MKRHIRTAATPGTGAHSAKNPRGKPISTHGAHGRGMAKGVLRNPDGTGGKKPIIKKPTGPEVDMKKADRGTPKVHARTHSKPLDRKDYFDLAAKKPEPDDKPRPMRPGAHNVREAGRAKRRHALVKKLGQALI